ncbi:AAA family ATPase [Companilactobacillus alimentarius]|uniref:Guanylate kinase n=1 Tax=Companilactobacillus alimentarius DSM 20249 TaxID=1423720 RepID=A0A2K9HI52_9LACO|nr:AAA family ATPase [Companilactobacillus alimentarius]AUI72220.1 guanylate kinase [Companilactobacillus alimentarius DSM 20249]KRK77560.1 Guanylate kinase [Companilactobacillus alimentarius DSM 20249]MDT6952789.1 AAA family ATPase [Companilactobacillus alimentarius]GEO45441.1 guanylate kinase [Companilactobacillus alimentarius]
MDKKIIVITGASGTGKTTISKYLKDTYHIPSVITHTTRLPREGEKDGIDYHFETKESFFKNHYLEKVEYSGHWYGSSEESLKKTWEKYDAVSIVVDTKGAISYKKKYGKNAVVIFLEVSFDKVTQRLKKRGDDQSRLSTRINSEEFQRDLKIPCELVNECYKITNDNIKKTEEKVNNILKSEKIK